MELGAHDAVDLAAGGDLRSARAYFAEAASCTAAGLEVEGEPWRVQVERDARLALTALDVLEGEASVEKVLAMGMGWQASRRAKVSVFGQRCSIRPVIGQAPDGNWTALPSSITADDNAIDTLLRLALEALQAPAA